MAQAAEPCSAPVPPAALLRAVQGQGHDIGAGADQDGSARLLSVQRTSKGCWRASVRWRSEYPASLRPGIGRGAAPPRPRGYRGTGRRAGCWLVDGCCSSDHLLRENEKSQGVSELLQHPRWVGNACLVVDDFIVSYAGFLFSVWPERTFDPTAPGSSSASPERRGAQASSRYSRSLWM